MQAAKIIPGTTYALSLDKDVLVRFIPKVVTTVQSRTGAKSSPHDYVSHVDGYVIKADLPAGLTLKPVAGNEFEAEFGDQFMHRARPEQVIGPYEEVIELRQRDADERAENAAQAAEHQRQVEMLRRRLYQMVGANAVPEKADEHSQMFRAYINGMQISKDGVAALYRVLLAQRKVTPGPALPPG